MRRPKPSKPDLSDHRYGLRPVRSAHQAIETARAHVAPGHRWCVELDLEKFFDRVNHDALMAYVARQIEDRRVFTLIGRYLEAGTMSGGLVSRRQEGTPQGGPLSPLLSNILLNELDRELERRGHCFVRYADVANMYVRSRRAGERVMAGVERFLIQRLKRSGLQNGDCHRADKPCTAWLGRILQTKSEQAAA